MTAKTTLLLLSGILLILGLARAYVPYDNCYNPRLEKVGCFKDVTDKLSNRALPEQLLNERDNHSLVYDGHNIRWEDHTAYLKEFACRCASKTIDKGYEYFGLQFHGECWSGDKTSNYKRHGTADKSSCYPNYEESCNDQDDRLCVGKASTNYVYRVILPVDGKWSKWSEWSECSATCGESRRYRARQCNDPKPKNGGKKCSGNAKEAELCKTEACDIEKDREYSQWSEWEECTVSCGGGVTERTRKCLTYQGDKICPESGHDRETKACNEDVCPTYCEEKLDVGILIDGSGSVGRGNFIKTKKFLKEMVQFLKVSPGGTHVGIIVFSSDAHVHYDFTRIQKLKKIEEKIDKLPYPDEGTETDKAVILANNYFFQVGKHGNRENVPDVMIVLTDGKAHYPGRLTRALQGDGIKALRSSIAVGIGENIDNQTLMEIARENKDNIVSVKSFDALESKLGTILKNTCHKDKKK